VSDARALREALEARLGHFHAEQRLSLEAAHEDDLFRDRGTGAAKYFHPENWYSLPTLIRWSLKLCGLWPRAQRNARTIRLVENAIALPRLPPALDGFRVLHLSDLHIDASDALADAIIAAVRPVEHDLCVLTGDYRFLTAGSIDATVRNLERLRAVLAAPVYAVLGNHDPVALVPALEAMSVRVLMNEQVWIGNGSAGFNLAGVDDRHYFGLDNLEKALTGLSADGPTVLLCHTPEIYRQAAHAGVDLLLSGHTHGGQMCLPGGWPILLDARIPRRLGRGAWRYRELQGYTSPGAGSSVVEGRLNCPPEITLHRLRVAADPVGVTSSG
jgi:predicted MPP superfamily phosphohydrolase